MAYRKRYYKKRPYRKRRQYKKRQPNTWGRVSRMASDGFFLAKKLARLVNVEQKLHEVSLGSTAASTSGLLWPIAHNTASYTNAITQGDGFSTRDGASVKPMHLKIKGSIWTNSALTSGARLRFIVFRHKNANDQTIFPTTYLDSASVTAFKNWSNRFHFKTIYDHTYNLNANSNEITGLDINLKMFGHIQYSDNSDLIENGAYYILAIADSSSALNMSWNARLTFVDN